MQTKRNVALWALYDFANSIVFIVFFLYFAQWAVIDRGVPDLHFNLTFTISALLLLCTAPFIGALLDKSLRRITGVRYTTVCTALLYGACALSALAGSSVLSLVFFTLGLYSYLLSFSFYTPLLTDIAAHHRRGFVSGLGIAANYAGQIAGLLLALPIATGTISFFGDSPRAETLLPAVVVFFVLALPMLLLFEEPKKRAAAQPLRQQWRHTLMQTKLLFSSTSVVFFLLSFFFFNDAILTMSNNFPIFLEQVWQVSDDVKTYLLLGILIACALGGFASGHIADRFGHKRVLMWLLGSWLVLLPTLSLVTNFTVFVVLAIFMGLWFGANWAVSRSLMSHVAPKNQNNLAFTYYSLAERASSFIGPIVWGMIVSGLLSWGSFRYRFAGIVMTVFILLGMWMLHKVPEKRPLPGSNR